MRPVPWAVRGQGGARLAQGGGRVLGGQRLTGSLGTWWGPVPVPGPLGWWLGLCPRALPSSQLCLQWLARQVSPRRPVKCLYKCKFPSSRRCVYKPSVWRCQSNSPHFASLFSFPAAGFPGPRWVGGRKSSAAPMQTGTQRPPGARPLFCPFPGGLGSGQIGGQRGEDSIEGLPPSPSPPSPPPPLPPSHSPRASASPSDPRWGHSWGSWEPCDVRQDSALWWQLLRSGAGRCLEPIVQMRGLRPRGRTLSISPAVSLAPRAVLSRPWARLAGTWCPVFLTLVPHQRLPAWPYPAFPGAALCIFFG